MPLKSSGFRGFLFLSKQFRKKPLDFSDLKNIARPHPFLSLLNEGMRSYFGQKNQDEHIGQTVAEAYQDFILAKTAEGVSDVTIRNYHQHLHNISKYLDIEQPMAALSKRDLESMVCEMRAAGFAHNSISTYVWVLRTFLNWCQREGRANLKIPNMKDKETVKETLYR